MNVATILAAFVNHLQGSLQQGKVYTVHIPDLGNYLILFKLWSAQKLAIYSLIVIVNLLCKEFHVSIETKGF